MRVACFIDESASSDIASSLRSWAESQPHVSLFHDGRESTESAHHYLNYYHIHRSQPFERQVYLIANSRRASAWYPFLIRYPGICVIDSSILGEFVAGISFSLDDPAGSGYLLSCAGVEPGSPSWRLLRLGLGWSDVNLEARLASAVASCADRVIVPEFQMAKAMLRAGMKSPVSVVSAKEMVTHLDPILASRSNTNTNAEQVRNQALATVPNVASDLIGRVRGQFFERHYGMSAPIELAINQIFDKINADSPNRSTEV